MLRRINSIPVSAIFALAVAGTMLTVACGSDPVSPAAPTVAAAPADDLDATTEEGSFATSSGGTATRAFGFQCDFRAGSETVHASRSTAVVNWRGRETVTCHGRVVDAPTSTQVYPNVPCSLHFTPDVSTISQVVVTKSGNATLRCQSR